MQTDCLSQTFLVWLSSHVCRMQRCGVDEDSSLKSPLCMRKWQWVIILHTKSCIADESSCIKPYTVYYTVCSDFRRMGYSTGLHSRRCELLQWFKIIVFYVLTALPYLCQQCWLSTVDATGIAHSIPLFNRNHSNIRTNVLHGIVDYNMCTSTLRELHWKYRNNTHLLAYYDRTLQKKGEYFPVDSLSNASSLYTAWFMVLSCRICTVKFSVSHHTSRWIHFCPLLRVMPLLGICISHICGSNEEWLGMEI